MTLDELVADPLTFRVGYNSTVRVSVLKDGELFTALAGARYSVRLRGMEQGAEVYALDVEIAKSSVDGKAEGPIPAWTAATVGKTFRFWPVLVDADVSPAGPTLTGDFEEVLGEFRRTIQPAIAGA